MPNYVLTYHGGDGEMPEDPAEIEKTMAAWGAWYGSIGADLVDGGAPFSIHGAVGADGKDADAPAALSGYTVITAADVEAAKVHARSCPVLGYGATVQISECVDMGG